MTRVIEITYSSQTIYDVWLYDLFTYVRVVSGVNVGNVGVYTRHGVFGVVWLFFESADPLICRTLRWSEAVSIWGIWKLLDSKVSNCGISIESMSWCTSRGDLFLYQVLVCNHSIASIWSAPSFVNASLLATRSERPPSSRSRSASGGGQTFVVPAWSSSGSSSETTDRTMSWFLTTCGSLDISGFFLLGAREDGWKWKDPDPVSGRSFQVLPDPCRARRAHCTASSSRGNRTSGRVPKHETAVTRSQKPPTYRPLHPTKTQPGGSWGVGDLAPFLWAKVRPHWFHHPNISPQLMSFRWRGGGPCGVGSKEAGHEGQHTTALAEAAAKGTGVCFWILTTSPMEYFCDVWEMNRVRTRADLGRITASCCKQRRLVFSLRQSS